ncbi:hypothetical protein DPEC_G00099130 [Dallia pectoralis]|uniref:Uncharacterized protein n=1 Tax=Dallia pectoralis TaxID=75939 RepID=A0ACC2GW54_DALPE|nr:hypothetical protein DPEC_G00099130 [Dallia pectoralis]
MLTKRVFQLLPEGRTLPGRVTRGTSVTHDHGTTPRANGSPATASAQRPLPATNFQDPKAPKEIAGVVEDGWEVVDDLAGAARAGPQLRRTRAGPRLQRASDLSRHTARQSLDAAST